MPRASRAAPIDTNHCTTHTGIRHTTSAHTPASYPHQFIYYCGAVDAGSGYARLLPCHVATKEVAKSCLELLIADLRMLMGLTHGFKPQVVVTDQGTQFMSHYFSDFLSEQQIVHQPAVTYTPHQQNSFVERMQWVAVGYPFWSCVYATQICKSRTGFPPFCSTDVESWICNRIPQPWRGNLSPYFMLSKRPAGIDHLPEGLRLSSASNHSLGQTRAKREGDKHFADRGVLGIYLGPSETSPGCVVYVPSTSTRRFYTSRDVICYEDTQPGPKNVDSKWRELQQDGIESSVRG